MLGNLSKGATFAPRKTRKFIERLEEKLRKRKRKKSFKKNFKFFLQETKRIFSFAPALRDKRKT
ncbi:hypothetical protein, partial [Flavobacterium ginsenosidimutans]|uniref:hypothetical protein n=1 Tax=Flavobacterium ginsenosidimutans TaxID=687844 RepID=UPI00194FDF11